MGWRTWRVQVAPGSAVVARTRGSVVVALPRTPAQESFLDELLSAVATAEDHAPGRRLARRIAGQVAAADPDDVPGLCLVSAMEGAAAALLVGEVELTVTDEAGGIQTWSGRDAATWVDRVVPEPYVCLTVTTGGGVEVDPRSDLQAGVVRGSGVVITPLADSADMPSAMPSQPPPTADEPPTEESAVPPVPGLEAEPPPPAAAAAAPSPRAFVAVSLAEPVPERELVPLPRLDDPQPDEGATDRTVQVQGILCSRGHFNDPMSRFCATCGLSMVHQTHNLVPGPRPPLGVVVLDDGSVYPLTGDYVLGREPEKASEVRSGQALPLPLEDADRALSRVHAKIVLEGWDVRVVDARSANGTYVLSHGDAERTRLVPDEPLTILPGTRITLGSRSLVFDSHRRL